MKPEIKKWLAEQFAGDEDIIAEVYGEYVNTSKAKLAELDADYASGDWAKLDRTVHTLKGNALMVGDTTVADASIRLRELIKAGDTGAFPAQIAEIKRLSAPTVGGTAA